jgi:hypothetical protein
MIRRKFGRFGEGRRAQAREKEERTLSQNLERESEMEMRVKWPLWPFIALAALSRLTQH